MDCNPKSRGRKHVLNKSKYNKNKPKPTLPKISVQSKSLQSNCDRYADELSEDYVQLGSDFTLLANAPIAKGNHFQFKTEAHKIQGIERTPVDTSGLFDIDLNLIGLSLSTIPFSVRCGIPDNYFSESEHNIMIQTAKNNEKLYQQTLQKGSKNINHSVNNYFSSKDSKDAQEESFRILVGSEFEGNYKNDDRKIVLRDKTMNSSTMVCKIAEVTLSDESVHSKEKQDLPVASSTSLLETESLQQWLDDVLGD